MKYHFVILIASINQIYCCPFIVHSESAPKLQSFMETTIHHLGSYDTMYEMHSTIKMLLTIFENHNPTECQKLYKRFNIEPEKAKTSSFSGNSPEQSTGSQASFDAEYLLDDFTNAPSTSHESVAVQSAKPNQTAKGSSLKQMVLVNQKTGAVYSPLSGNYSAMSSTPLMKPSDYKLVQIEALNQPIQETEATGNDENSIESHADYLYDGLVGYIQLCKC